MKLSRILLAITTTMMVLPLASASDTEASGVEFGHSSSTKRLIADLSPLSGGIGQGEFRYISSSKSISLQGGITLPVAGTFDSNEAVNAIASMTIDTQTSNCTLNITGIHFKYTKTGVEETANYEFSANSRSGSDQATGTTNVPVFRVGSCSANAIPVIVSGSSVVLKVSISNTVITSLNGVFE